MVDARIAELVVALAEIVASVSARVDRLEQLTASRSDGAIAEDEPAAEPART